VVRRLEVFLLEGRRSFAFVSDWADAIWFEFTESEDAAVRETVVGACGWGMGSAPNQHHHRVPQAVDERASKAGLRTVAFFEATKGLLALALTVVLIAVRHRMEDLAEEVLYHLHIGFDERWAQALLHGASDLSDMRIWTVMSLALAYATVRFVEAWGLWYRRVWAEWFALLSGTLYLPFEIQKVAEHQSWLTVGVLMVNLLIILYMLEIRIREMRTKENTD
jgi:uncharacterized membrane protein (DUF2068 family)